MKKWLKKFSILIIPIFCFSCIPIYLNNKKTEKLTQEMLNAPLPNKTELIELFSGCGNTSGTGDHVEIWIGLLVKSELSKRELLEFYRNSYKYIEVYEVTTKTELEYCYFIMDRLGISFENLKNVSHDDGYFIVGRTESPASSFDIRGM